MFRCAIGIMLLAPTLLFAYDPLAIDKTAISTRDFVIKDEKRSREIPVRVYFPKETDPAPVVLFSHGLGGNREGYAYLGKHWSARGYIAIFVQHPGSDDRVWKETPLAQRMAAMQKAANLENFQLRVQDIPAVLNQLERWNSEESHSLKGRMDLKKIGMSGHSFGALTTQAVSGQGYALGRGFTDPRIQAAVMMSPSAPRKGVDTKTAFGSVKIPWLLLTGTKDNAPIVDVDAKSRLLVYPALPDGGKYELVLNNAQHSAFSDRALPGDSEKRNPNHHRAILATTTAFWDAYLRNDSAAKKWLDGEDVKKVLEKEDRWQRK